MTYRDQNFFDFRFCNHIQVPQQPHVVSYLHAECFSGFLSHNLNEAMACLCSV